MKHDKVKFYAPVLPIEHPFADLQFNSLERFKNIYLADLFGEFSPIVSYDEQYIIFLPTKEKTPYHLTYWFEEPPETPDSCIRKRKTYAAPLYVKVALYNKKRDEHKVETVYFGEIPLLTNAGTCIINGVERIVVAQITRAPGVYYEKDQTPNGELLRATLIPERGRWLRWEIRRGKYIVFTVENKRFVPATLLLRALGALSDQDSTTIPLTKGDEEEILALFDNLPKDLILNTFKQEDLVIRSRSPAETALVELFRRIRPGDVHTLENARAYIETLFFNPRNLYLGELGRHKFNHRFGGAESALHLTKRDIVDIVRGLIEAHIGMRETDDIDHLGNRRVRGVGELLYNHLRVAFRKMERLAKERMTIADPESISPSSLLNVRPFIAAVREFFGSSQHVQLAEQVNPLSEITHKRTMTALGPGGLSREQAGFEVRDVHHSHYGRICPIETPEGLNIGLINRLALLARVNRLGLIETPYRRVKRTVPNRPDALIGHTLAEDIHNKKGATIAGAGTVIDEKLAKDIHEQKNLKEVAVLPYVSDEIVYLTADVEDHHVIAPASTAINAVGEFIQPRVAARHKQRFVLASSDSVEFVEVGAPQILGISAGLIPFIEHDEASRALMGSNMQRQAVPLIQNDIPIVGTGIEEAVARASGRIVISEHDGEVVSVSAREIVVKSQGQLYRYPLQRFGRTNQSTCLHQRPCVVKGQRVKKGDVLADNYSTQNGVLALGRNVLVAFLAWEGYNYEDAIIVSERLVKEDVYTSIHLEDYDIDARDTKIGPETFTRDIPNVPYETLKDLDENGIARIGAYVRQGDILVGKITPKGEKEITPEERLLRAIFGEKMREVKDASLYMPHGEEGIVIDSTLVSRDEDPSLPAGVVQRAMVRVAQKRRLSVGDKMAGRHGNKGVVAKIVPEEDMPFLEDGTPVDIILNPLGVPSRMNIGQILETHLGWAAKKLGFRAVTPTFGRLNAQRIEAELCRAWLMDRALKEFSDRAWQYMKDNEVDTSTMKDDVEVLEHYLLENLPPKRYNYDLIRTDEIYRRRAVLDAWLREMGHDPDAIVDYENDQDAHRNGDRADEKDRAALRLAVELWLRDHGVEAPKSATLEELRAQADAICAEQGDPPPYLGKMRLIDGKTGEPFDRPVVVGYMHVLKLIHLVDDKIHARSTGPYSIVTQQPLGGRAHFGGQRLGEMEVWALEAYGAAHTLQEMLTVKSDDVQGRVDTYEAIIKGQPFGVSKIPASFKVLVKELQAIGLSVEAIDENGEVYDFGKEKHRPLPNLGPLGLLGNEKGE